MSFDPVWWALARKKAGCSGGSGGGGSSGEFSPLEQYIMGETTTVSSNTVTRIGESVFDYQNKYLPVAADFPAVTSIGNYAFYYCGKLQSVNFPAVTSIGLGAFGNCKALTSVSFPSATDLGDYTFHYCTALEAVNLPVATRIGKSVFQQCTSLTNITLPAATSVGNYCFDNCKAITTIDFYNAITFESSTFSYCTALSTLILRSDTVSVAKSPTLLNSSIIAAGTGYIYVPAALVDTYKAATNWSTYAAQFRALEDYTVDGTTTGALDETKI